MRRDTVGPATAFNQRRTKMALDGSVLGNCASEQMEALEEAYGEDENVTVGAVITIVQVLKKIGEGEDYSSTVRMRHNIPDPYAAIGYLTAAQQTVIQQISGGSEG
jgi:hypothetical protein